MKIKVSGCINVMFRDEAFRKKMEARFASAIKEAAASIKQFVELESVNGFRDETDDEDSDQWWRNGGKPPEIKIECSMTTEIGPDDDDTQPPDFQNAT